MNSDWFGLEHHVHGQQKNGEVIWLFCHRKLVTYYYNQRRNEIIKRWFCVAILYTTMWNWTVFNFLQNQSGIYYDVDFEQDVYSGTSKSQPAAIPLSTYTMSSRAPYYCQWSLQHTVLYKTPNRTGRMKCVLESVGNDSIKFCDIGWLMTPILFWAFSMVWDICDIYTVFSKSALCISYLKIKDDDRSQTKNVYSYRLITQLLQHHSDKKKVLNSCPTTVINLYVKRNIYIDLWQLL